MFTKLKQSLPARLLLLFFCISLLLATLMVGAILNAFHSQWRDTIGPHVEQYLDYISDDLGHPPSQLRATELADKLRVNIYIEGPENNFSTTGSPLDLEDLEFRDRETHSRSKYDSQIAPTIDIGEHNDRTVLRNRIGDYQVIFELPHKRRHPRHKKGFWFPLLILGGILGLCYWQLRRMLKPVQEIKQAVMSMGAGQLDTRVPIRSSNDLGMLSMSINTMATDIQKLLDAKRQLLLGASHELRTPITRAKLAAQMLEPSTNRDRIIEDLDEMEQLITDIMESERVTGGHSSLTISNVDLCNLANSVLYDLDAEELVSTSYSSAKIEVPADAVRLNLLLRNIVGNALAYGSGEKMPELDIAQNQNSVTITLRDYGPGIDAAHLPKITEPFYRADPSRERETGGFGLGLHISDLIVQAHGGAMVITNGSDGTGAVVTVTLPYKTMQTPR